MSLQKFAIYFIILITSTALGFYLLDHFSATTILIPHFWLVFTFMAAITLIIYFLSVLGIKKGGEYQSFILLGGIVIRLLASMAFVLIYLLKVKVNGILFIGNFFSIYFLFTVFEIYCLLRNLRHQIKK
ncbi:hypothetical protein [Pedobacter cryophilus]|uniref:hypothetical protein n=1 Tax=Pedobacter cryophilus TaxID=2571271 RepID=UPI001CECC26B|nr:hypothetical protein [Pedobacter cryophilus]